MVLLRLDQLANVMQPRLRGLITYLAEPHCESLSWPVSCCQPRRSIRS
jgi:hypothetical protein